jgi:hypothetical protein
VSPAFYTPAHLAEKIINSKAALEGERKQVTVLFADLKGSMELLADRDPEEARKILDPVLQHMMDAVHRYEGTVNQVMGDGIMALFGAPLAHEDHAVRACQFLKSPHRRLRLHLKSRRLVSSCSEGFSVVHQGRYPYDGAKGDVVALPESLVASLPRQGMLEGTDAPLHRTPINTCAAGGSATVPLLHGLERLTMPFLSPTILLLAAPKLTIVKLAKPPEESPPREPEPAAPPS